MRTILLLATIAAAFATSTPIYDSSLQAWEEWKLTYNVIHTAPDYDLDYLLYNDWKTNIDIINDHNAKQSSYRLAPNKFTHLSNEEFRRTMTGSFGKKSKNIVGDSFPQICYGPVPKQFTDENYIKNLPQAVDWRAKGAVTRVKDQGQCGSCWAFATTGPMESLIKIKTGVLYNISEQQLVDCAYREGNDGCAGGLTDNAFVYAVKHGMCSETDYPYVAEDDPCKESKCLKFINIKGCVDIQDVEPKQEETMRSVVASWPIAIGINGGASSFQSYQSGVLDDPECNDNLDHGVMIVGYNTTSDGKDYWIIKNSWGLEWGQDGYIYVVRGMNECGLAEYASYPVL